MNPQLPIHRTAPYVYRVYEGDDLIYIGSTIRLWKRLDEHRLTTWWAESVTRVQATLAPTIEAARRTERRQIRQERPRWNISELRPLLRSFTEEEFARHIALVELASERSREWTVRRHGEHAVPPLPRVPEASRLKEQFRFRFGHPYSPAVPAQDTSRPQFDGQRLRALRETAGIRMVDLALAVGCAYRHLANFETGCPVGKNKIPRNLSPALANRIARELSGALGSEITIADFTALPRTAA